MVDKRGGHCAPLPFIVRKTRGLINVPTLSAVQIVPAARERARRPLADGSNLAVRMRATFHWSSTFRLDAASAKPPHTHNGQSIAL